MTEHPQLECEQGLLGQVIARLDRLEDAHRQEMTALGQHLNRRLDAQLRCVASLQVALMSILLKVLT